MIECQFDIIKSLGHNMDNIQGIVGGAIMADGKVGLILDIDGFFSLDKKSGRTVGKIKSGKAQTET